MIMIMIIIRSDDRGLAGRLPLWFGALVVLWCGLHLADGFDPFLWYDGPGLAPGFDPAPPAEARRLSGDPHANATAAQDPHAAPAAGAHAADDSHGEHVPHQQEALFFLFNGIILGTAVVHATSYVPALSGVQPTVAIFALGIQSYIRKGK